MEFVILIGFAYAVYIFIAESINPFKRIKFPMNRKRRRLGALCAGVLLLVGLLSLLTTGDDLRQAGFQTGIISLLLTAPFIVKFFLDSHRS